MNHNELLNIDFFQIYLFLLTAQMRSISKACEELHIEQSTGSRKLAVLEQELGVTLLNRNTRPVSLTNQGEFLYEEWKPLYHSFERSVENAREQQAAKGAVLTVGMVDSGEHLSDIPAISRSMKEVFPDLVLTFLYSSMSQWPKDLEDGITDIAVSVLFDAVDFDESFAVSEILTVPKLVAVRKTSRWAKMDAITFEDLKEAKFISISDKETPRHANYIRQICRDHGFEPAIGRRSANAHGLISTLQNDDEVLVCDRFLRDYDNPEFQLFELPDTWSGLCAVYSKTNRNPYIQPYIKALRKFYNNMDEPK